MGTLAGVIPVGGSGGGRRDRCPTSTRQVSSRPWSKCSSRGSSRALDRRALFHDRAQGAGLEALEQVPHSDHFGAPARPVTHVTEAAGTSRPPCGRRTQSRDVLPSGLRENNRSRAIAAVSGIAAAALVVAGLASGGAQQRQGSVSAQGPRTGSHSGPGGRAGSPAGLSPGPAGASGTLAASSGPSGARHAFLTGQTAHTGTGQPDPSGIERTAARRDGRGAARDDRHVGSVARNAPERAHERWDGRRHELPVPHICDAEQSDGTGRRCRRQHSDNCGQCCHHRQSSRQRRSDHRARDRRAGDRRTRRRNDRRTRRRRSVRHRSRPEPQLNNGLTTRDGARVVAASRPQD